MVARDKACGHAETQQREFSSALSLLFTQLGTLPASQCMVVHVQGGLLISANLSQKLQTLFILGPAKSPVGINHLSLLSHSVISSCF